VIPGLSAVIETSVEKGVDNFVIGCHSRGRFNLLANIFGIDAGQLFQQFLQENPGHLESSDVKHHLGNSKIVRVKGKDVTITMLPNPSHLEAIDPVVSGFVRGI
jgi:2-oxoglutarate dehydrogenase E1 component